MKCKNEDDHLKNHRVNNLGNWKISPVASRYSRLMLLNVDCQEIMLFCLVFASTTKKGYAICIYEGMMLYLPQLLFVKNSFLWV